MEPIPPQHRSGKRLDAGNKADEVVDLPNVRGDKHTADGCQTGADHKGGRNDHINIDADQKRHLAILRSGTHGLAQFGVLDEQRQPDANGNR